MRATRLFSVAVLAAVIGIAGCRATQPTGVDPEVRARVASIRTVALAPLNVEARERPDQIVAAAPGIEARLVSELEAAGFRVIRPAMFQPEWDTLTYQMQNFHDAVTGDPNPEVMPMVKERAAMRMAQRHGVDAIIVPSIRVAQARVGGSAVTWDGATMRLDPRWLEMIADSEDNVPARMAGLSLHLEMITPDRGSIWENWGGVELVGPIRRGSPTNVPVRDHVRKDDMLTDTRLNEQGIRLAMMPIVEMRRGVR
jgi:hypothetical protein